MFIHRPAARALVIVARTPDHDEVSALLAGDPELPAAEYGVLSRRQLASFSDWEVRQLVSRDQLLRIRQGWFANAFADADVVSAVRLGGVLSCASALKKHGVWVPESSRGLHVRPLSRDRLKARLSEIHFCSPRRQTLPDCVVDGPLAALVCAAYCLEEEEFVVVCDSALHQQLVTAEQLLNAFASAADRVGRWLSKCDGRAASGTETLVRLRLRSRNIKVELQALVPNVGYVDLLVGNRLIIEADSRQHHTAAANYANDRRRDLAAAAQRYLHIRLTYAQVVHDWVNTERQILAITQRREHRSRPEIGV